MDSLFRLRIGLSRDPKVDAWFDHRPDELGHIARVWFDEMRSTGNDVLELIHDGCPVACVKDVPFGYVNVFTHHVNIGFFRGASLEDPGGLLQGKRKQMKHVKVSPVICFDRDALKQLIWRAYVDVRQRCRSMSLSIECSNDSNQELAYKALSAEGSVHDTGLLWFQ